MRHSAQSDNTLISKEKNLQFVVDVSFVLNSIIKNKFITWMDEFGWFHRDVFVYLITTQ